MNLRKLIALGLIVLGILIGGKAAYLQSKALLAQWLISSAWHDTRHASKSSPPWPWADFTALAKLSIANNSPLYVLDSGSNQALAFGPTHVTGSTEPGKQGQVVIAAHNDSHFKGLQTIQLGDSVTLTARSGITRHYQVVNRMVIDVSKDQLLKRNRDELILITCYPFNSLQPNGPLRFIVWAEPVQAKVVSL